MSSKKLFAEFAPVSKQAWVDKATENLKGADFEKKLVWRTDERFNIQPFYTAEDMDRTWRSLKPEQSIRQGRKRHRSPLVGKLRRSRS